MLNHEQPESKEPNLQNPKSGKGKSLTLRTKATLLAISIGVIPVAAVGTLSFNILNKSLTKQIGQGQIEKTEIASRSVTKFLEDRINEIDAISKSAVFTNSKLRDASTLREKAAILDSFKDELKYYNSIVFFNPQGDPVFQAKSDSPNKTNYGSKGYFQEALKTQKITINGPGISPSSGQLRVEFAAPVKDRASGEIIGVLRFKIPGNYINGLFDVYQEQDKHWNLVNEEGTIFAGDRSEYLNQPLSNYLPEILPSHLAGENKYLKAIVAKEIDPNNNSQANTRTEDDWQLVSYVTVPAPRQFPELRIGTILSIKENIALAPVAELGWTLFLGTAVAAIVVAGISAYIANRATLPLLDAVAGVKKIGQGDLDTRLDVTSQDELGELNTNINLMTEQIQTSLEEQKLLTEEQRIEKEKLESAIYTLLDEVGDATDGDLTVRANLDNLELSTVADLFNAIISNLQDIAIEARQSSGQVGTSLKQNEEVILMLAQNALTEAKESRDTLLSVQLMSESIQAIAKDASQAEKIAGDTYNTVIDSTNNMDLTVDSIVALRNTVGETSKKMKRLGESSQKISQVVSFIEEIAMKTNVLSH